MTKKKGISKAVSVQFFKQFYLEDFEYFFALQKLTRKDLLDEFEVKIRHEKFGELRWTNFDFLKVCKDFLQQQKNTSTKTWGKVQLLLLLKHTFFRLYKKIGTNFRTDLLAGKCPKRKTWHTLHTKSQLSKSRIKKYEPN